MPPGDPAEDEEIDPKLPAVPKFGDPVHFLEHEFLDGVGDGTRQVAETDPGRRGEVDYLGRLRGVEVNSRVVPRDDEVLTPGQDFDP